MARFYTVVAMVARFLIAAVNGGLGFHEDESIYRCPTCRRWWPWFIGGTDSEDCDECWADEHGEMAHV